MDLWAWKTWRKIALWSVTLSHPVASGLNPAFTPGGFEGRQVRGCMCELHSWRGRRKQDSAKLGFWKGWELLEFAEWFEILSGVPGRWVRDLSAGTGWRVEWQVTPIYEYHKALQSIPKLQAPGIWMMYLYLWIYLYLHEKPLTTSLIVIESTAEIFWQGLCAKPTENFLIKSCHGPMVRNPQKNTLNVALSTALWPGNRQGINSKHKAGTSQKPCCKSHNPDIPAVALLFHLDVASRCQKPHTSWAFYGFLGNIFRIFLHHFSTMLFFSSYIWTSWR